MKKTCKKLAVTASLLGALWATAPAHALVGVPIFATGGDVTLTFLGYEAGYKNTLNLTSPDSVTDIFVNKTTPVGTTFDLGSFAAGTELVFSIFVSNTGLTFFTGPGASNPDGVGHADVVFSGLDEATVGFEDLHASVSDNDYNDLIFGLSGVGATPRTTPPVPEPSEWLMFSAGLLGLGMWVRRRQARGQ